jgi:hypothetical protein
MLDFTDEGVSITSPPVLSHDTQTVSGNLQGTEVAADSHLDIDEAMADYWKRQDEARQSYKLFVQTEDEDEPAN